MTLRLTYRFSYPDASRFISLTFQHGRLPAYHALGTSHVKPLLGLAPAVRSWPDLISEKSICPIHANIVFANTTRSSTIKLSVS